jgi:O-acetyl-ADP-ribose deacetylase (regulator of RNase III)
MKIIKGDLIQLAKQEEFNLIIHGCNCQGVMGSGIARQIRTNFPFAYAAFKEDPRKPEDKLGTILVTEDLQKKLDPFKFGEDHLLVINAYTQLTFGRSGQQYVSYDAIRTTMKYVKRLAVTSAAQGNVLRKIAYPKIGAGLGGGDWDVISKIIDEELDGEDHTLVEYNQ